MADEEIAVILYGNGAGLGDFRLFADDTVAEMVRIRKFARQNILVKETLNRASFFGTLSTIPVRFKIAAGASMKIWGCNSGITGWVYTDDDSATHHSVSDQNASADFYYWRTLNTRNVPKPSIAQALADYFGIRVYGAGSGSHIEVQRRGEWITSDKFKAETGRWPGAPQTLRLHPDRGVYKKFDPRT